MIAITGATGNTGSVVAEKLLENNQKIRVIGRSAEKLKAFTQRGAEAFVGDVADADAMARAFTGAEAVYTVVPADFATPDVLGHYDRVGTALAAALKQAGTKYVVNLSGIGAQRTEKVGPVSGLRNVEQKLNAVPGLNVLHLRAAHFMENLLMQAGVIRSMGFMAGVLRGELAVPMISVRDIGAAAADALLQRNFSGSQARDLLGPRDISFDELARIVGAAIGQPGLRYQSVPGMMARPAFQQLGFSSDGADKIIEMYEAANAGILVPLEKRSPANTTPTTIEQFVQEVFAPQFLGKSARA